MKRLWLWIPFAAFFLFFGVFAAGLLHPASKTITSKLIGQPLPSFALPPAYAGRPGLSSMDLKRGQPRLLNIFASWCLPCAAEAPVLGEMARRGVRIDAIAIRDEPADVARFLARYGNPYQRIGSDTASAVQIALGSSGVPETFVIDGKGIIRHQHVGDIQEDDIPEILAALREAQ